MKTTRGFTLIELLVVIAIIGILSSVVLASLNSARKKGRDARRVADLRQMQLALELYYDKYGGYPQVTDLDSSTLVSDGFISAIPHDPSDNTDYSYAYATNGTGYHMGASLEDPSNSASNSDADCTSLAAGCFAGAAAGGGFNGADSGKCNTNDTGTLCYDVKS
jgi:prepilin-type N-terminal cleavage/methylation domain-containing protein